MDVVRDQRSDLKCSLDHKTYLVTRELKKCVFYTCINGVINTDTNMYCCVLYTTFLQLNIGIVTFDRNCQEIYIVDVPRL